MFFAAADDHVARTSTDGDVAGVVHSAEVTGVQPTVGVDGGRRRFGHAEVVRHLLPRALADLPDGAHRHGCRCHRVGDLHLPAGIRSPDGARLDVGRIAGERLPRCRPIRSGRRRRGTRHRTSPRCRGRWTPARGRPRRGRRAATRAERDRTPVGAAGRAAWSAPRPGQVASVASTRRITAVG